MARPPGRVCAHTPVAVNRVDSFGDFDIVDIEESRPGRREGRGELWEISEVGVE